MAQLHPDVRKTYSRVEHVHNGLVFSNVVHAYMYVQELEVLERYIFKASSVYNEYCACKGSI
jgi:hypothetical protein